MDNKEFSKKELVEILDAIQFALRCKNEADVKRLLERTKELVCGEYSICGLAAYNSKGLPENKALINGSYPEGWFEAYREKKLYEIDPIVWHHHNFLGTQIWADTYKRYKDKIHPEFIYNANGFGLCFGIAGGIHSPNNILTSIISFAGSGNNFGAHQKAIIDIITPHFHQALLRVCRGTEVKPLPPLTAREKEIIKWMKDGKTSWEISMILGISGRTVKYHIENIKMKLDAMNTAQAVAIAMEQGEAD